MLGGERRDARKLYMLFAGAECVADGEDARVEQADNIARVGLADDGAVIGHQARAGGQLDVLALLHVERLHAALKLAGADAQERNAVTVVLIHVGLDLEDKAAELLAARLDQLTALRILARQRGGGQAQELL